MSEYTVIEPYGLDLARFHGLLLGAVAPRPIALASTVDTSGVPNLAPFSYFNVFSTRPPVLIIGPSRAGRNAKHKDTALNAFNTFEVVVNVVSYAIARQMNITSASFEPGIDEFTFSGLTPISSEKVKPFRVKESPVQMECKVREYVSLGSTPGAGNLIICDVLLMHIHTSVLDEQGRIDPAKIDLVGRCGQDWYARTTDLFDMPKPPSAQMIGFNNLPENILKSTVLTGNDLGMLAEFSEMPTAEEAQTFRQSNGLTFSQSEAAHYRAKNYLSENKVKEAWCCLLD